MADARYLLDLMRQESEAVKRLWDLLCAEEEALVARNVEEVKRLAEEKTSELKGLERFAAERQRLLSEANLTADRAGFESLLKTVDGPEKPELAAEWEALRRQLTACRDQNQKNGQILEANRRVAGEVLSILLGEREGTELYGSDGSKHQPRGNHTYAKV